MMPDIDPRKERVRQRVRACMCVAAVAMTVLLLTHPWQWVQEWVPAAFAIAISVLSTIASAGGLPGGRERRGGQGRSSGLSGRGRDDSDAPAGPAARRSPMLVTMSRLMPRSAGHRWLAEADSLLSEITPTRRGAAIRSYLRSAPRLAVTMWAQELLRRARLGPRRPG
jgi:hypothetical protein